MPFLAPSFARLPPLAYLLADQVESRKHIARHLGVSLRALQRYDVNAFAGGIGDAPRRTASRERSCGQSAVADQVFCATFARR